MKADLRHTIAQAVCCRGPCLRGEDCIADTRRDDKMTVNAIVGALTFGSSAPAGISAHNSGECDPSVTPDCAGAGTAIGRRRQHLASRIRVLLDKNQFVTAQLRELLKELEQ